MPDGTVEPVGSDASHRPQARLPYFTILFGIVAPILCLLFDPIVFQSGALGHPLIPSKYQVSAYAFIALEIAVLLAWLVFGKRVGRGSGIFSGVLGLGALGAFGLGVIMFPFSLIGLFMVIGIFGFIPFVTSFVFLGNAVDVWNGRPSPRGRISHAITFLCGFALPLLALMGPPIYFESEVRSSIKSVAAGSSPSERDAAVARLQNLSIYVETDELVRASESADPDGRARLNALYFRMTGRTVEQRVAELND